MSKPWICPRCNRVWGPTIGACAVCNGDTAQPARPVRDPQPVRRRRPERVPGSSLHDALYTPTINEFEDGSWRHDDDLDEDL